MDEKQFRKFNILSLQKLQIKHTLRFLLISLRMTKIKKSEGRSCWQKYGVRNYLSFADGMYTCTITVVSKAVNKTSRKYMYTILGHILKGPYIPMWKQLLKNIYCYSSHNKQKLKAAYMSTNGSVDKENVVPLHNELLFNFY